MELNVTRWNRVICEESGNSDSSTANFLLSTKVDNRLSKDNLKFYKVKWVYGGGQSFKYPKIELSVGDEVITEAIGIDIEFGGKKYKIFDVDFIVAKLKGNENAV